MFCGRNEVCRVINRRKKLDGWSWTFIVVSLIVERYARATRSGWVYPLTYGGLRQIGLALVKSWLFQIQGVWPIRAAASEDMWQHNWLLSSGLGGDLLHRPEGLGINRVV